MRRMLVLLSLLAIVLLPAGASAQPEGARLMRFPDIHRGMLWLRDVPGSRRWDRAKHDA